MGWPWTSDLLPSPQLAADQPRPAILLQPQATTTASPFEPSGLLISVLFFVLLFFCEPAIVVPLAPAPLYITSGLPEYLVAKLSAALTTYLPTLPHLPTVPYQLTPAFLLLLFISATVGSISKDRERGRPPASSEHHHQRQPTRPPPSSQPHVSTPTTLLISGLGSLAPSSLQHIANFCLLFVLLRCALGLVLFARHRCAPLPPLLATTPARPSPSGANVAASTNPVCLVRHDPFTGRALPVLGSPSVARGAIGQNYT